MRKRIKTDNSGFTIVELMIVVAIIGLLAGIASYNVMGGFSFQRYRVKSDAVELVSEIRKARNNAIRERRDLVIAFDTDINKYFINDPDRKRPLPEDRSIRFCRGNSTPAGVAVGFPGGEFSFCSRGLASSDGFVYMANPGGDHVFRVGTKSRAGAFMLQEWRDGQWN